MFVTIDNPGNGNCGYYAMAIGLIHLIQQEQKDHSSQDIYLKWQSLDDEICPIEEMISYDLNLLAQHPSHNKALLDRCQKSLRTLLVHSVKADFIKKLIRSSVKKESGTFLESTRLYINFIELIKLISDPTCTDQKLSTLQGNNSLKLTDALKTLALQASEKISLQAAGATFKERSIIESSVVSQLLKEDVLTTDSQTNPSSIFLESSDYYLNEFVWANDYNLREISELFDVQLLIHGENTGMIDEEKLTIRLTNQSNIHWVTNIKKEFIVADVANSSVIDHFFNLSPGSPNSSGKQENFNIDDFIEACLDDELDEFSLPPEKATFSYVDELPFFVDSQASNQTASEKIEPEILHKRALDELFESKPRKKSFLAQSEYSDLSHFFSEKPTPQATSAPSFSNEDEITSELFSNFF